MRGARKEQNFNFTSYLRNKAGFEDSNQGIFHFKQSENDCENNISLSSPLGKTQQIQLKRDTACTF